MNNKRPVHLALWNIKFPITAIVSILHRISGVLLFLAIPFLLWLLDKSLASFGDFVEVQSYFASFFVKSLLFIVVAALLYHLIAGIRHLLMDLHFGETLVAGRRNAYIVVGSSVLLIIILGFWLW